MKFEANPHVSNCPVCGSHDLRKVGTDSNSCRACGSVITDRGMLSWGERRLEQRRNRIPYPVKNAFPASFLRKERRTGSVAFPVPASPAPLPESSKTGFNRLDPK